MCAHTHIPPLGAPHLCAHTHISRPWEPLTYVRAHTYPPGSPSPVCAHTRTPPGAPHLCAHTHAPTSSHTNPGPEEEGGQHGGCQLGLPTQPTPTQHSLSHFLHICQVEHDISALSSLRFSLFFLPSPSFDVPRHLTLPFSVSFFCLHLSCSVFVPLRVPVALFAVSEQAALMSR